MNRATKTIVATFGILAAIGGLDHGLFEALQGNTPTPGLFVQAIGPAQRMWVYGTEDAFTLIPNFLVTGLLAMTLSLAIMVWCNGFVHKKGGLPILILLCILLFLVGGGVAQVVMFILVWAVAAQINSPLTGWRKALPETVRRRLAPMWPGFLAFGSVLFFMALEIAVAGFVPGVNNPDQKEYLCWSLLGVAIGAYLLAIVAGFAHDLQAKTTEQTKI
jgi:hypothetical protein